MNRKKNLSCLLAALLLTGFTAAGAANVTDKCNPSKQHDMEKLELTSEWDKVFPQSDKVNHSKVTFHNRYGITLVADLYVPKQATGKLAAIAVSGPFGAVKEQSSGLYAQTLVYGREWRPTSLCGFARHQYGRLLRGRRLSVNPR